MSKKRVEITGTLQAPLTKGCAAFIQKADGSIRTSAVQHFITCPSGLTYIETKNTRYVLHPPVKAAQKVGVRS